MRTKDGLTNSSLEVSADLKRTNIYRTHVSGCLSSATAAWIAAEIVAIKASFAAGLRPKVAPISTAKIFSAASIASALSREHLGLVTMNTAQIRLVPLLLNGFSPDQQQRVDDCPAVSKKEPNPEHHR